MFKEFLYGGASQAAAIGTKVGLTIRFVLITGVAVSAFLFWIH